MEESIARSKARKLRPLQNIQFRPQAGDRDIHVAGFYIGYDRGWGIEGHHFHLSGCTGLFCSICGTHRGEEIRAENTGQVRFSEPWADTASHAGKMIMTIFAGIAEFERDLIRERTGAGREAAKKRGVQFGRPRKIALDQSELAQRLILEGKSVREIASVFKVHPATIYRLAAT